MTRLSERFSIQTAIVNCTATLAYSQPFSLADVKKVTVLCGIQSPLSSVEATAIAPVQFTVMVGTNATLVSAMTSLTSGSIFMGQTTIGEFNGWQEVAIFCHGTLASGRTFSIDGTTFETALNASVADKKIMSSNTSVGIHQLVSAIATWCPNLQTHGIVTANNATATAGIYVRMKPTGAGEQQSFNAAISLNASSSDQYYIQGIKQTGIIEFTPSAVLATNASYTHFSIRLNSTVSARVETAIVIREVGYSPAPTTSIKRTLFG